jgi:cell division protein FtsB
VFATILIQDVTTITQEVDLEFDFGSAKRKQTKESLASDRLQKAIDRNRAKQEKRSSRNKYSDELDLSEASGRGRGRLPGSRPQIIEEKFPRSGLRRRSSGPSQAMGTSSTPRQDMERRSTGTHQRKFVAGPRRAGITTQGTTTRPVSGARNSRAGITTERKAVGTADNVEFSTSVKRSVRKSPAKTSYSSAKAKSRSVRKVIVKTKLNDKKTIYTVRFLWATLGFLTLRLIFSGGGVIDFYTNRSLLQAKVQEYKATKLSSENLTKEIKRIKIDSRYQKKLVRDHLGFIAADEYMILFPKERS